jgi:uncharacterized protein (TIGR01244 family)
MKRGFRSDKKWLVVVTVLLAVSAPACGGPQASSPPEQGSGQLPTPAETVGAATLLPNGAEPFPGILTGGQPTLEQLEQARRQGVTTVINLRTPSEGGPTAEQIEALGLEYVSIPVAGSHDYTAEKARDLAAALAGAGGDAIVYCRSGNRVGALFAVKARAVDGVEPGQALELGRRAGLTRAEPDVRRVLGLGGS